MINNGIVLNTVNTETVYNSLAKLFNVSVFEIKRIIMQKFNEINDYNSEGKMWKSNLPDFIPNNFIRDDLLFSHVVINHIACYPDVERIRKEGMFPLQYALTKQTTLSDHLKKYDIEFEYNTECNQIVMKKDGKEYKPINKNSRYLLNRLNGVSDIRDFGINGFLWAGRFRVSRIRGYLGSPEILKRLSAEFDDITIADSYLDDGNNYLVSIKIPIDCVDFQTDDNNNNKNNFEKTESLIKNSLVYLSSLYCKDNLFLPQENIMYVNNDYSVPSDDIVSIRRILFSDNLIYAYPEVSFIE